MCAVKDNYLELAFSFHHLVMETLDGQAWWQVTLAAETVCQPPPLGYDNSYVFHFLSSILHKMFFLFNCALIPILKKFLTVSHLSLMDPICGFRGVEGCYLFSLLAVKWATIIQDFQQESQ